MKEFIWRDHSSVMNAVQDIEITHQLVLQEIVDAEDGLPVDKAHDLFEETSARSMKEWTDHSNAMNAVQDVEINSLVLQEMVDAVDGLPADLAHDSFEKIVPEITLLVLSRNG